MDALDLVPAAEGQAVLEVVADGLSDRAHRGCVCVDGVPVADALQCFLDVRLSHARGYMSSPSTSTSACCAPISNGACDGLPLRSENVEAISRLGIRVKPHRQRGSCWERGVCSWLGTRVWGNGHRKPPFFTSGQGEIRVRHIKQKTPFLIGVLSDLCHCSPIG